MGIILTRRFEQNGSDGSEWAVSSGGEHYLDTVGVTSSNLVSPTKNNKTGGYCLRFFVFQPIIFFALGFATTSGPLVVRLAFSQVSLYELWMIWESANSGSSNESQVERIAKRKTVC